MLAPEKNQVEASAVRATKVAVIEKLAFNVREVCVSLGISPTTLWRLEKRNVLKPLPGIGRHKLFNAAAVRRLAERGAEINTAA